MAEAALSIAAPFLGNAHKSLECALNSFLCCDKVHLLMTKSNNGHGQDAEGSPGSPGSPGGPGSPPRSKLGLTSAGRGSRRIAPRSSNLRAQDGGKRQDGDKARKTEQQFHLGIRGKVGKGVGKLSEGLGKSTGKFWEGKWAPSSKCRQRLHVNCCCDGSNNCKQWESVSK